MAESGFVHGELTPCELLEVMARLGDALQMLWHRGAKVIRLPDGALGTCAGIFVPDIGGRDMAERKLLEVLQELKPHASPRPHQLLAGHSMSLEAAILWLLISSRGQSETAQPVAGEWLVVAQDLPLARAARLTEDLRFHATALHLAPGQTGAGLPLYLYHLRAERRRRSSFESFITGGGLQGAELLAAFDCQGQTVFLPAQHAPSRRALGAFRRILTGAPQLFGVSELQPDASGRLLAVVLQTVDGRMRASLLLLNQLAFVDQLQVTPAAAPYLDLEVHPLGNDEPALGRLRRAVAEAEPRVGHRLELRTTSCRESSDLQIRRLTERIAELRHRLAYARSLQRSQPVLLRFTPRQVPALADAIRSFPVPVLREGLVRYGFQVSRSHPQQEGSTGGWHYLLYEPVEAMMREPSPPWRWLDLGGETRHFWLDPYWAEYNFEHSTTSLVFVPRGLTLFPPLHPWDPDDVDRELLRMACEWFPASSDSLCRLREPIYLFEGAPQPDARIRLQVLDRAALQPLSERLGWINDHLLLQETVGGADELIEIMAADVSRRELADRMRAAAEASVQSFHVAAQQANLAIAADAAELQEVMTGQIAEISRRCRDGETRIADLLSALQAIEEAVREVAVTPSRIERAVSTTDMAAAERLKLLGEIEKKLHQGSLQRDRIIEQSSAEVERLLEAEAALRRRLRQSRRRGRGRT